MNGNIYLLLTGSNRWAADIIYSRDTDLKVKVYNLALTDFTADANEIQLYAYNAQELLVFETIDIAAENALDMILAIKWYTNYLGCPEMEILADDPRMNHGNEIAV